MNLDNNHSSYNDGDEIFYNFETYESFYVKEKNNKYGIVNNKGKEFLPCIYDKIYTASHASNLKSYNIAAVVLNNKLGFIDDNFKEIIPCIYDNNGYWYGCDENIITVSKNNKKGVIDLEGNTIVPFKYDYIDGYTLNDYNVEIVGVKNKNGSFKYGMINKLGKKIVPIIYNYIDWYNDFYIGYDDLGEKHLLNSKGKIIYEKFNNIKSFSFNAYRIKVKNKWGLINKDGKIILPCIYDYIFEFKNGLSKIQNHGMISFINCRFKQIVPYYSDADNIDDDGLILATLTDKKGFIDKKGKVIIPYKYDDIIKYYFKSYITRIGNKYGIIKDKKELVPCQFTAILELNDKFLAGEINDKTYFVDLSKPKQMHKFTNYLYNIVSKEEDKNSWGLSRNIVGNNDLFYEKYNDTYIIYTELFVGTLDEFKKYAEMTYNTSNTKLLYSKYKSIIDILE